MLRSVSTSLALMSLVFEFLAGRSARAVPAFARQRDLQCNACHTRPPRLNSVGEQVHLMGFQIPSAARPGGLVASLSDSSSIVTRWSRSSSPIRSCTTRRVS